MNFDFSAHEEAFRKMLVLMRLEEVIGNDLKAVRFLTLPSHREGSNVSQERLA